MHLNSASPDQLAELPMIGRERSRDLADARPFSSWEEVKRVPGFSTGLADDLQSGGARLD